MDFLRTLFPDQSSLRLFYHKIKAMIAAIINGFPSSHIAVIGVTGTKGKTTTVNLIAKILQEAGYKVGIASTTNFQVRDEKWINTSKMTTLSPFFLQKLLRRMVVSRCQYAVIEVSSHALTQNRIWGINFDTIMLTNIGEDHLEYHGGFREYLRVKGLLFSRLNRSNRKPKIPKISILNVDDENFAYFDQFLADKKYSYGLKSGTCHATDLKLKTNGVDFIFHVPNDRINLSINLPGEFNVYNAVAAATASLANGIKLEIIKEALEKAQTIPGRFEQIHAGQPFAVIVDYAHTEQSLKQVLQLYKKSTEGNLYIVFGATGGGRDTEKRPRMGMVADQLADVVILTDDDPYVEDSIKIIEEISKGIKRKEGQYFWKIPSRYEAIRFALLLAQPTDTVIIAGKGAETVQINAGRKIDWDDREVAREILSKPLNVEL